MACLISFLSIACQGWSETNEIDPKIAVGELPNGLKYYIRENHYPPERASLRLVVKVGSLHETETERGVAHFLEHLNFRGSRHFADGEIIRYLESIGAWFGPDTNAETSLESTTYILEIPLDQEGALEQSLLALRDFAGNALLTDETIEKERHVVLDEMHRALSSADFRLFKKSLQIFLPESPLGHSMPIGTQEIISRIEPAALRAFYNRWYRSDRMAVVAVGDFNAVEIQQKIEKLFSDLLPSEGLPPEISLGEISEDDSKILIHFDSDLAYTRLELNAFFPTAERKEDPKEALKEKVLSTFIHNWFQKRLAEFQERGLSIWAFTYEGKFLLQSLSNSRSLLVLLSDSVEAGMRAFHHFLKSIRKNGLTIDDFQPVQDCILEEIRNKRLNLDRTSHHDFVEMCIAHFMQGEPLLSYEWLTEQWEAIIRNLTLEECNDFLAKMHFGKNAHISFSTSDPEIHKWISADLLADIFNSESAEPIQEERREKQLFSYREPDTQGTIAEVKQQGPIIEWILGNQMKILLKSTDLEHDRVTLLLQSNKGLAHAPETDYGSAAMLIDYMWNSGLNGLGASEFQSHLRSLGIDCAITISLNQTTIAFSSPKQHLETAFQIAHDLFYPLSFDRSKWSLSINRTKERIKQMKMSPVGAFYLDLAKTITQDHYFFRPLDCEATDPEIAESFAPTFFGVPQDFTAILVGDFDEEAAQQLTKRYLASLPVLDREIAADPVYSSFFPSEKIEKDFAAGNQTYEQVVMIFPFEMDESPLYTKAACKLMNQRLLKQLRWQAGGTYRVGVEILFPFSPFPDAATVQISFTCQQMERASLIQATFEEIEKWKMEFSSEEEMDTLKELLLKENQTEKLSNDYWVSRISNRLQQNIPLETIGEEEIEIKNIEAKKIREILQILFANPYYSILTHIPAPKPF